MAIDIKIEKQHLYLLSAILIFLVGTGIAVAEWDTSETMFHNAEDVKVNIDGTDYSLQEALDNKIIGKGQCVYTETDSSYTGDFEISLLDGNGNNVCEGHGCDVFAYKIQDSDGSLTGFDFVGVYIQEQNGDYVEGLGAGGFGTNGDGSTVTLNSWNSCNLKDDFGGMSSKDSFVIDDNAATNKCGYRICSRY